MASKVKETVLADLPKEIHPMIRELIASDHVRIGGAESWQYMKPAFIDAHALNAWGKICKRHSKEEVAEFIRSFIHLQFKYRAAQNLRAKMEQAKHLDETLSVMGNARERLEGKLVHVSSTYEQSWVDILRVIQENREELTALNSGEYLDSELFALFFPLSRNKEQEKAEAFFVMRALVLAAYMSFTKPYHRAIAAFVNAMFDAGLTYSDISNNTRNIKDLLYKLEKPDKSYYRESQE